MNCEQCKIEIVDYLKDELGTHRRRELEAHLADCQECRKERELLGQTFDTLARELIPIELSAHFRMALADRLDAATLETEPGHADPKKMVRPSERHIREMKRPVIIKLWDHAKRSPYFAASLVLHAAALLIICAAVVKMQAQNQQIVTIESRHDAGDNTRPRPEFAAYLARRDAHRIKTRAVPIASGMRVDLSQLYFMGEQKLVLVGDNDLQCIRGYFVDSEQQDSRNRLMARYPAATTGVISNAEIDLPSSLAQYLSQSRDLFVFRLKDRLEFWSRPTWNQLRRRFAGRTLSFDSRDRGQLRIDGPGTNRGLMTSRTGVRFAITPRRRWVATL